MKRAKFSLEFSSAIHFILFAGVLSPLFAEALPFAYVANAGSNDLSVVDTASNLEVARIQVGLQPFGVGVAPPDGRYVFVANQGSNDVSIIDTSINQVSKTLPVGDFPYGVAFTPDGSRAYVANNYSGDVTEIDALAQEVIDNIPVAGHPWELAVTPDATRVYVSKNGGDSVSVIDLTTHQVNEIAGASYAVALSGDFAYFTVTGIAQLKVLDTRNDTWVALVQPVAVDPYDVNVTSDGSRVWVSGTRGTITVLDTTDPTNPALIHTIALGNKGPREVAFHPSQAKAYVALFAANTLGVISTDSFNLTEEIPVGTTPQAVDIGP